MLKPQELTLDYLKVWDVYSVVDGVWLQLKLNVAIVHLHSSSSISPQKMIR